MIFEKLLDEKQAFIFELDEVLYPEKDYLLQVYYLFSQFIEYSEQLGAAAILAFMQETYQAEGPENIFEKTVVEFNIPLKYKTNYELLLQNARLPLKLLLFNDVLNFLKEIMTRGKQIFLFVGGDPAMQLNKIRQTEWNGLEHHLTVYFAQETVPKPDPAGLLEIMEKHKFKSDEILFVGKTDLDALCAANAQIDFLEVDKLLLT